MFFDRSPAPETLGLVFEKIIQHQRKIKKISRKQTWKNSKITLYNLYVIHKISLINRVGP